MIARGVALLVAACLAAACSSGGRPSPVSPPATSTPSTAGTTPAAPTTPPASSPAPSAAGVSYPATMDGAFAIVKALYAAQDTAIHKRDAAGYVFLTDASCACRSLESYVQKLRMYHEHLDGENFRNVKAGGFVMVGMGAQVPVTFDFSGGKIVTSSGALAETDPARRGIREVVSLRPVGNGWKVFSIQRLSEGKP